MEPISDPHVAQFLVDYPNRQMDGNMLVAVYGFESVPEAIDFVTQVAEIAEQIQHHPDIFIQYTAVTLSTTTHDAHDTITNKDLELVQEVEQLFG